MILYNGTDEENDYEIGPWRCRPCWLGWHDSCEQLWCECDADEHNEPETKNG